jgi:hypothetical protein
MKILYNDSIKHGKNSTLEIKLECSYMVSGMMERGWGKVSFPKGGKCSILNINKTIFLSQIYFNNKLINKDKYDTEEE